MPIVGSHQQAPVTIPVNGTSPVDADEVRLNDNAIIGNYNQHDNDATIHVQSSSLATRPLPGTAGRVWLVTDDQQLYYDTGSAWVNLKLDASSLTSGTVPTARVVGAYDNITSVGTLDDLAVTGPVTAGSANVSGNVTAGSLTGPLTGNVTGNVTGNADTATALSSARTFALSGDVTGSVNSDLNSGATIAASYTATVPVNKGGTGQTATPTNGQLLIGNGSGFSLAALTAGNQIAITNTPGGISIAATGAASGVGGTGTPNQLPRWDTTSTVVDSAVKDDGSKISLERAQLRLGTLDYTVPTVAGAANTALVNNGSGSLAWATIDPSDVTITPTRGAPYSVGASDVGKRLVIGTTSGRAGVVFNSTGAVAVGSKVWLFCKSADTQIQVGTAYEQFVATSASATAPAHAVQSDGRIVVAGTFTTLQGTTRNRIGRLNADLSLDTSFDPNANADVYALAVQSDGKILVGGNFTTIVGTTRNYIARLNSDGTLDTSFDPNANGLVRTIAVQSDGKVLLGGDFTTIGGTTRNRIARVNSDGTLDTSYNPNAGAGVQVIRLQSDGKAVVGGSFTTIGGQTRTRFARLNTDGTADTLNLAASDTVRTLAIQSDGAIIVGYSGTTFGGSTRNYIARVTAAGALDTGYNPNAGQVIYGIALQSDGKAVVGGAFTTMGGTTRNRIARLNTDGTLDTGYDPNANNGVGFFSGTAPGGVTVLANDRVMVGGSFTTIAGVTRNYIAVLNTDGTIAGNVTQTDTLRTVFGNTGVLPQYALVQCEKTATTEWTVTAINFVPTSVQTFDSSGTWEKPATGSMALVEAWGAGGGGGNSSTTNTISGGGGGSYMFRVYRLADLPSSVSVTIGAGGAGAGAAIAVAGTSGGNTTFGSLITAYGGGGGPITSTTTCATGGTYYTAGGSYDMNLSTATFMPSMGSIITTATTLGFMDRVFNGGSGITSQYNANGNWRSSVYGGGGGVGSGGSGAGTSVFGGNGGAVGVAGTTPAGGGGGGNGTSSGTGGGAGGGGRVRITVW